MTCDNCGTSDVTTAYCEEHAIELGEIEENLYAEISALKDVILLAITLLEDGAPNTALARLRQVYSETIR